MPTTYLGKVPAMRSQGPLPLFCQLSCGPNRGNRLARPRGAEWDRKQYFENLPSELQRVLRVQLRQPGDVSAVIEAPGGFLLYVAKETTGTALTVACLTLPKRSYEEWLYEQSGEMK